MRHALLLLLACATLAACGNPSDAEGWAKRAASRSRLDEKLDALGQVRKAAGDRRAAVPHLVRILEEKQAARARGEAAAALGEIGDPAATPALLSALALEAPDRDAVDARRRVVEALGALRAREAVPKLQELTTSPDGFTQVAAVDALGRIGDPAAVETLVSVATGDGVEPFTAKKALLALGRIGDPRAGKAVMRMLFEERPGVTFFPEAAFAASQIGKPMAAPLLAVLEGRDPELAGWARSRGIVPGALYAKSAQLLGDVAGAEAAPALVSKLAYRDADPGIELYVRVFAAESLGRLRAREAVRPLAELAAREQAPGARDRYCDALVRIGDPAAVPALRGAAASGGWDLRQGPLTAISRLGGKEERAFVAAAQAKDCAAGCDAERKSAYAAMLSRLDAAAACGETACWIGKLSESSAPVRDRAALEIGRAGAATHAPALAAAIAHPVDGDADLAARYHAVLGLAWLASREPLGAAGAELAERIDATIVQDRGRAITAGVNEEALRLATRLRREAAR
jgi:HEAT repeat protein